MSNGQSRKTWILEGTIIVGLFTFLGYIYAFNYESGYAGFFKIPSHFININLPQITMAGSITIAIVIFLLWLTRYGSTSLKHRSWELSQSLLIFVLLLGIILGDLFVYGSKGQIVYGLKWEECIRIAAIIILLSILLIFLFQRIIMKERDGDFPNPAYLFRRMNIESVLFFIVSIAISILLIAWIGKKAASSQEEFLVPSDHPNMAVLRIYGDNLVCAEFDEKTQKIKPVFSVLKLANNPTQTLSLKKIGRLKVE